MKLKSKNIWELSQTFAGLDDKTEGLFLPNKIINYWTQESQIISQTDVQAALTNKRISILDKNLALNSVFHHTWNVIKTSFRHVVSAVQHRELKLVLGLPRPPTVRPRSLIEGFSPDADFTAFNIPFFISYRQAVPPQVPHLSMKAIMCGTIFIYFNLMTSPTTTKKKKKKWSTKESETSYEADLLKIR